MSGPAPVESTIPPDHPALAGHFPDAPVVPAAVILDHVASVVRAMLGPDVLVTGIVRAKFGAPLRPGETFETRLVRIDDAGVDFVVQRGAVRVAAGRLLCRRGESCGK